MDGVWIAAIVVAVVTVLVLVIWLGIMYGGGSSTPPPSPSSLSSSSLGSFSSSQNSLRGSQPYPQVNSTCNTATNSSDIIATGHWNGDTSMECWAELNDYKNRDGRGLFYVANGGPLFSNGETDFYLDLGNGQIGDLIYQYPGAYGCPPPVNMQCRQ